MQEIGNILRDCGIITHGTCRFSQDLILPKAAVRASSKYPALKTAANVIVCALPYFTGDIQPRNLALYAIVPDYHTVLMRRLTKAAAALAQRFEGCFFLPFVDASPLQEVKAAVRAGLGARGKNTQLICPALGSMVFLGAIVTDAPLSPTEHLPMQDVCTGCRRCEAACPTKALHNGRLDPAKCRSAITQKKGALTPFEETQIAKGALAWGCDLCTLACPHNAQVPLTHVKEFTDGIVPVLTEQNADALLKNRAFAWRGKEVLLRNLRLLKTNSRKEDLHDL